MMMAPPHIHALLAAYTEVSGLPVRMSAMREWALGEIHARGFGPEDVRAVVSAIRKKIARGEGGWTEASANFSNAMGDPDKFEERALLLRQQAERRKGSAPRLQTPRTDAAGVTRLDDEPLSEAKAIEMAAALNGLARDLSKGARVR